MPRACSSAEILHGASESSELDRIRDWMRRGKEDVVYSRGRRRAIVDGTRVYSSCTMVRDAFARLRCESIGSSRLTNAVTS